ncbi:TPA: DUF3102 domain-containing protein [Streptococcus pyogenes]|nr:DUF3102 domain-containing protein [Streptococcus pyogenes]
MNEITLSNNLAQIELEINHHKQIVGQSVWEIGRRLNHVKKNDLAHGQFEKWVESLGMATSEARKFMTVAKQLPNRSLRGRAYSSINKDISRQFGVRRKGKN